MAISYSSCDYPSCDDCPLKDAQYCNGQKRRFGCTASERGMRVYQAQKEGVIPSAL